MIQSKITDDLQALIAIFPASIQTALAQQPNNKNLIEVVMDLGRRPKAYYSTSQAILTDTPVTNTDIDYAVSHVGHFMDDNRAGIERTLHRISAIRNRQNAIIGLTCRVGRAVYGTIDIVQDLLVSGKSILLLGRPGVGKTTLLREAARILAEQKRVIVVDTSNEIAGDGDIPHPAIGSARRMQVPRPDLQHHVMIEAVENHTPEVIIIDEIGRLEEAAAARTIAERGVQLIGTAHGNTLDNLLVNPILADLVGGIESVTLSDEEARRRNTQKSVLERKSPPTFDILIEIQTRDRLVVHHDVARAVDMMLRNRHMQPEVRTRDENGEIKIEKKTPPPTTYKNGKSRNHRESAQKARIHKLADTPIQDLEDLADDDGLENSSVGLKQVRIFLYGANRNRLGVAASELRVPIQVTDNLNEADVMITLKNLYRKNPQPIKVAEENNVPLYVLRSNTIPQMERCLIDIFELTPRDTDFLANAMRETQDAIRQVLDGATKSVELLPQRSDVRRRQHEMARQSRLISQSHGEGSQRRVRIYRS